MMQRFLPIYRVWGRHDGSTPDTERARGLDRARRPAYAPGNSLWNIAPLAPVCVGTPWQMLRRERRGHNTGAVYIKELEGSTQALDDGTSAPDGEPTSNQPVSRVSLEEVQQTYSNSRLLCTMLVPGVQKNADKTTGGAAICVLQFGACRDRNSGLKLKYCS